ncbi:hypothetical protein GCM10009117_15800 [Gangjinia marincola]|uniref:HTH cro/C1-type domain-containing protein n=1 Tax=Gangjinia marincola TaxID=578463 RepID=A0ABP3XVM9_9FLAO
MSELLKQRKKLNLTQDELAERANISVRTIQRIESGQELKGHTLNALSKALGVSKDVLIPGQTEQDEMNWSLLKIINTSSLFLIFVPLASILIPLAITRWKNAFNPITKQIITLQILWTCALPLTILMASQLGKYTNINHEMVPLAIMLMLVMNAFIIIRNTIALDKKKKLFINLNFNIL